MQPPCSLLLPLIRAGEVSASLGFAWEKECILSAFEAMGKSLKQGQKEPRKCTKQLQLKPYG